jgi:hypothetical protein
MLMSCDRCRETFEGFDFPGGMTGGYYLMEGDWASFKDHVDEEVVCDNCMFKDHKYIEIYGKHNINADS